MFCEKCGAEMVEGAAFCYKCGAPAHVEEPEKTEAPKPAEPASAIPVAKIMEPSAPVAKAAEPAAPVVAKPVEPVAKPAAKAAEPAAPVVAKPVEEAAKPAEPEAKPAQTVPQPAPQSAQAKPQPTPQSAQAKPQPAPAPQQQYQQNTYYNTQSGYYQQTASYNPVDSTISTARTLGILAIVGACTITLGGLICGIIGLLKVKDLQVPPQLEAAKRSAKKLNVIGICLAIGFMILAFILVGIAGCSAYSYY